MILFNNIEYGERIYNYMRSNILDKDFYYIDGSTPTEKREYIKKQLEITDNRVKVLISSYGTTATGLSIKALTNLVMADSYKSAQRVLQSIGRILRLHSEKEKAIVFDLVDIFHSSYKTTLYNHFISRRDDLYKPQEYPFEEMKIVI